MSDSQPPVGPTLTLPEAIRLLIAKTGCTKKRSIALLERAIGDRSLQSIATFYPDGAGMPAEVETWQEIDWDSGIVTFEPSWAGSPPEYLPIVPVLARAEVVALFGIDDTANAVSSASRGGRPARYDWDAFWVELCRRIYEEGIPKTQRELVDHMLDWFSARNQESIDRRTIEKKISKLLDVLRPD